MGPASHNYYAKQKYFRNGKSAGAPFRAAVLQMKGTSKMKSKRLILSAVVALAGFLLQSKANVILNSADSFAVLGGSTVTSTGNTILNGDLGVYPGTAITGFGPGIVNGATYAGGLTAQQAENDGSAAYNALSSETAIQDLTGQDLGGLTLGPGVRNFNSTAQLTGTLTLDAQGDSNARFDFQIGSTLTTASSSSILLINGAQADNVFWQVGSSATLGADTSFYGSILADQSITLNTGASMSGRALAMNDAVTLDDNVITVPTTVPEPASFWLLAFCASVFGAWQRVLAAEAGKPPARHQPVRLRLQSLQGSQYTWLHASGWIETDHGNMVNRTNY
jgi:type VI secretion system secreted protein VgrG